MTVKIGIRISCKIRVHYMFWVIIIIESTRALRYNVFCFTLNKISRRFFFRIHAQISFFFVNFRPICTTKIRYFSPNFSSFVSQNRAKNRTIMNDRLQKLDHRMFSFFLPVLPFLSKIRFDIDDIFWCMSKTNFLFSVFFLLPLFVSFLTFSLHRL